MGRSSGGGMASMMDEMQKTLARRRAKVDRSSEEPSDSDRQDGDSGRRQEIEKSSSPGKAYSQPGSQAGSESPRPGRTQGSRRGSLCGDTQLMSGNDNIPGQQGACSWVSVSNIKIF